MKDSVIYMIDSIILIVCKTITCVNYLVVFRCTCLVNNSDLQQFADTIGMKRKYGDTCPLLTLKEKLN